MKKVYLPEEKTNIEFKLLTIRKEYGTVVNNIYYVVENHRSFVMEKFRELGTDERERIIDLISRMATCKDFKSPIIKNHLKGYDYGEIRPKPSRFFFFHKFGSNIIFFDYVLKKKDSFNDSFYKNLKKKKDKYEKAFEECHRRNG